MIIPVVTYICVSAAGMCISPYAGFAQIKGQRSMLRGQHTYIHTYPCVLFIIREQKVLFRNFSPDPSLTISDVSTL